MSKKWLAHSNEILFKRKALSLSLSVIYLFSTTYKFFFKEYGSSLLRISKEKPERFAGTPAVFSYISLRAETNIRRSNMGINVETRSFISYLLNERTLFYETLIYT
jgi:hypothetical protein